MKYILIILFFWSSLAIADIDDNAKLVSFFELPMLQKQIDNHNGQISMRGYLLNDEGVIFFCSNMESCYSRGKDRVRVIANYEYRDYLIGVSGCHMELTGIYQPLSEEQKSWPMMGYFEVAERPKFDFNPDYHLINVKCKAYKIMRD